MKKPTLAELLKTTFYISTIGYGEGKPAILALMKKTFVHKKEWISEKEFMNALSLAQILPGATDVSIMGYIGFKLRKLWDEILTPLLYIFPVIIAMIALAWTYFTFGDISFIYFLSAPVKLAIRTSMASFVWIALVGAIFKIYQGVVNIPVAITLVVGALIGAIYGAKLVTKSNPMR